MNKLTRTLALLAALAMTATAFVGCGDDKDSSSSSAATTVAEESSEETSAAEESSEETSAAEESSEESSDSDATASTELGAVSMPDTGDALTVLCWTDTDLNAMIPVVEKAYPDMAGKIKYQNVGSAGQEAMEQLLQLVLAASVLVLGLLLASLQAVFVPLLAASAESTPIPILFVCPDFAASVLGNPAKQKLHARFVPSSPDWSVPAAVGVPPADNSATLPEHCRLSAASYSAAVLSTPRRVLPYLSSLDTRHRLLSMHRPADFAEHLPESETAVLDPIHQLPPQRLPA